MEAYTEFATVYDTFMDNVPYEAWEKYLVDILKAEGINDGLLLELGCGTGRMTRLLAAEGYDMIGVDNSEEMLSPENIPWKIQRYCIFFRICGSLNCMEPSGQ